MTQNHSRKKSVIASTFLALLLLCLILASCTGNPTTSGQNQQSEDNTPTSSNGANDVDVFVEPDAGYQVITDAISSAKKSVWVQVYLLTEPNVISALQSAAKKGKDVRVMLEDNPYGGGGAAKPQETMDKLKAAGAQAKATNPKYRLTHSKLMILDGTTAYIMTANLTKSALGGSSSAANREYGIIDKNPQDVKVLIDMFNADWDRKDFSFDNPNLVLSPLNSRSHFLSIINNSKKTLLVEAEEMQDDEVENALIAAAKRGVQVQVIVPKPRSMDNNDEGIKHIKKGGVKVKFAGKLIMHAKIFIADGQLGFVGSENISTSSLDKNREVGILVTDPDVLSTLQKTFSTDWDTGKAA